MAKKKKTENTSEATVEQIEEGNLPDSTEASAETSTESPKHKEHKKRETKKSKSHSEETENSDSSNSHSSSNDIDDEFAPAANSIHAEEDSSNSHKHSKSHSSKVSLEEQEKKNKNIEKAQPEVNIGLVGHVDHGKTTLTEKLSGKWTDTHSEEVKRGITIRLGYADSVFRKCPNCDGAEAFTIKDKCDKCSSTTNVLRKVSFVDAPGHESLMATMLAGTTIMDGALLVIAANEECPQPQTQEHLMALDIIGVENVIIVQNKIDLVSKEDAMRNYKQVRAFLKGTRYENAPVLPLAAQHNINLNYLIATIEEHIKTPHRDTNKEPVMLIARSFDINRPGTSPEKMTGGVLGGTLKQGIFKVGDEIEIRPGRMIEEKNQKIWKPLTTKITGIVTGGNQVDSAVPGGSIGVQTKLDPSIVKSDKLTGNVVGHPGKLPNVWYEFTLQVHLLERVVGTEKELQVDPIKLGEVLMLNVNSAATVGVVDKLGKNQFHCKLKLPVCAEKTSRVTISRKIGTRFRLIGYGNILN